MALKWYYRPMNIHNFERTIADLTRPLNGQYPRPWMTKLTDQLDADLFIVGKNQRHGYDCDAVGSHDRHLDALFNRNGEQCRNLYEEMTRGRPSPTRKNTDRFVQLLKKAGVTKILETNVICYSTPMSSNFSDYQHLGGSRRGEEIFRYLLETVRPKIVVVHGASAANKLSAVVDRDLTKAPDSPGNAITFDQCDGFLVTTIPSLAPPAFNKWCGWPDSYLCRLANEIVQKINH